MTDVKPPALAELIDSVERVNEWKDPQVARNAKQRGANLTTSDLSKYRTEGMRHLVPEKIAALGAGLEIPAYRVALAVLADHGIEVPVQADTPERAIEHDFTLSVHTRRSLLLLLSQERKSG